MSCTGLRNLDATDDGYVESTERSCVAIPNQGPDLPTAMVMIEFYQHFPTTACISIDMKTSAKITPWPMEYQEVRDACTTYKS